MSGSVTKILEEINSVQTKILNLKKKTNLFNIIKQNESISIYSRALKINNPVNELKSSLDTLIRSIEIYEKSKSKK